MTEEVRVLLAHAPGGALDATDLDRVLKPALAALPVRDRRVLLIVPDATRTLPMAALFRVARDALLPAVRELRVLVALGTHPPMSDRALSEHLGMDGSSAAGKAPRGELTILQHRWTDPGCLQSVGELGRAEVSSLSRGMIDRSVQVRVNREVLNADLTILLGPVYPHELIGFSG
jgi:nickel-dependent lactate racemase